MEQRDIVVIGGGPAGLAAAMWAKLDDWNTLVVESNWVGGQGAIAFTVKNYPGFPTGDGSTLMAIIEKQVTSPPPQGVGAELRLEKVVSIDADNRVVISEKNQYQAKAVILATGSTMMKHNIPGEDKFIDKGVSYYAVRDSSKFNGKRVLVIGGGNSAVKSAIVAKIAGAKHVALIHHRDSLRAGKGLTKTAEEKGIDIWYNTELEEIMGIDKADSAIVMNNVSSVKREEPVDWVIICLGTDPDTKLAHEAKLDMIGKFIKVDGRMMTNKPGIFACGEVTGTRSLILNVASGVSAGTNASEYLALEMVKRREMFKGSIHGKYADEYLAMLG